MKATLKISAIVLAAVCFISICLSSSLACVMQPSKIHATNTNTTTKQEEIVAYNTIDTFNHMLSNSVSANDEYIKFIYSYFEAINSNQFDTIASMMIDLYVAEYSDFFADESNNAQHIGVYNIIRATVVDIREIETSYACDDEYSVDNLRTFAVITHLQTYYDSDYYKNGQNIILISIGMDENNLKICEVSINPYIDYDFSQELNIGTLSFDTPVASTYAWTQPSTIRVQNYSSPINFKTYCKVVMAGEVNYSEWGANAFRACAMAIKNYAWMRIKVKKYPNLGYDVRPTDDDQVYNPSKTRLAAADAAVDYTWKYVMLDADLKLFPGFHVQCVGNHSHACESGGVLSQDESQELSSKGKSWRYILHYYYDHDGLFTRTSRNKNMAFGSIVILDLTHSITGKGVYVRHNDLFHKQKCTTCGCYHLLAHNFVYNAVSQYYKCTQCGLISYNITLPASIDIITELRQCDRFRNIQIGQQLSKSVCYGG